ncbi:YqiA/YcfP family alpha/beta fold hydrolase [Ornithinibacillus scapharcae]|uniref:YqiA/YcfP family alpha/beta fold hydrolase n=1 Tax=Ornithinibacillus scapharcae TaxID=1147159 RepID=UPI000225B549|nr:prolyl oligopeptidase family serine peptidase [Ornithinibacillus scapharcae]
MIGIKKEKIAGIPSLTVVHLDRENDSLPTVVYFHGITSAKEHNLPLAFLLAEQGIRVILPDSMYHGERESADIQDVRYYLFNIVLQNVKELEMINHELVSKNLILDGKIGVAGTSMGGITTAAALSEYQWIKTAAILMGSPKLTEFARELVEVYSKAGNLPLSQQEISQLYDTLATRDLSLQAEKLNDRPLLIWHGDRDSVVPFEHSYSFYQKVKKIYRTEENIHFIREKDRDHKVSRPAILETVKWFVRHL